MGNNPLKSDKEVNPSLLSEDAQFRLGVIHEFGHLAAISDELLF
jgi:hypothetical protein